MPESTRLICGVDEAGRGPIAGPVFAAAVLLDPRRKIEGLKDSKLLAPQRREALAECIRRDAHAWAVASATVEEIDRLNADLKPLRSFVLPGGSPASAVLHLSRTVCRRAERLMAELADTPGEEVSAPALKYVNRLSDFLFVAARYLNDKGAGDVLWQPGQNR